MSCGLGSFFNSTKHINLILKKKKKITALIEIDQFNLAKKSRNVTRGFEPLFPLLTFI